MTDRAVAYSFARLAARTRTDVRRSLALASATAWMASLLGSTTFAQDVDPRSTARTHIGPVYLTPRIVLQDFGLDSNVFNSVEAPESDLTLTVTPAVDMAAGVRRARLTVRSATDFVYFATHGSERSMNQDFAATCRLLLGRVTGFANASYLNTRRRAGDEIDARSRRVEWDGEAGIGITVSSKLSARLSRQESKTAFDANAIFDHAALAERLNRATRGTAAFIRYAATPLTTMFASGGVTRTSFERSPIRNADSWKAFLGVELHPRALISGSAQLGYQRFRPHASVLPEFAGMVGTVDVYARVRGATVVGVSLDRNLAYSYLLDEPYYVAEAYAASVKRQMRQRFDVELRARRVKHRYTRLLPEAGSRADDGRTDTIRNDSITFGYRANTRTLITLTFAYWERRSVDRDDRNSDRLRVGTSVAYEF